MIEVGRVYKLNAPYDLMHDHHVFVFHSRIGMSHAYSGKQIYHVIHDYIYDFDSLDWDTEYTEDNFIDVGIEMKDYLEAFKKTWGWGSDEIFYSNHTLKYLKDRYLYEIYTSPHRLRMDGYLRLKWLKFLLNLFDDDYDFIPLDPPN